MTERVVITGLGAVSAYGAGVDLLWQGLVQGESKVRRLEMTDDYDLDAPAFGADVRDFDFSSEYPDFSDDPALLDRGMEFALVAAREAYRDAHHDGSPLSAADRSHFGVYLGVTTGGIESAFSAGYRGMNSDSGVDFDVGLAYAYSPATWPDLIAHQFHADGILRSTSTSCYSGAESIGLAYRDIQDGATRMALAGGTDAPIVITNYLSFRVIGATSRWKGAAAEACRPFSADREGMVFGEGAGFVMMESLRHAQERHAHIYAEVVGYAATSDGESMVRPSHDGWRWADAITSVLEEGGVAPDEVDYVNCHGTGTVENDKAEARAILHALGREQVPVGSIKSMLGHAFGGAGGLEVAALVKSMEEKLLPPTANYGGADSDCLVDPVPGTARRLSKCQYALKTATGFGGSNLALLLKRWPS